MPTISEFYGLSVYMYNNGREHNPPHVHVFYGDLECVIDIHKCKKTEGKMPKNKLRLILAWCEIHKDELLQNWELATKKMDLRDIAPLVWGGFIWNGL